MNTTAQDFQKLLTDAIHKQIVILGPQITLLRVHNIPGLTVTDDGTVTAISGSPNEVVVRFLEQFRELSSQLVKKTMKPLLSAIGPISPQETTIKLEVTKQPVSEQFKK